MNWGPWYIVNLTNGKDNQVIVHTYAEHVAFVMENWRMIELIGPFDVKSEAEKISRIENLNFKEVSKVFNVSYWSFNEVITLPKPKSLLFMRNIRNW